MKHKIVFSLFFLILLVETKAFAEEFYFIESWNGQYFMQLASQNLANQDPSLPKTWEHSQKPTVESFGTNFVWTSPLVKPNQALSKKGKKFKVFTLESQAPVASCTDEAEYVMTRGIQPYGEGQNPNLDEVMMCGTPQPMAKLNCTARVSSKVMIAIPDTQKDLLLYRPREKAEVTKEVKKRVMESLEKNSRYRQVKKEALAKIKGIPDKKLKTGDNMVLYANGTQEFIYADIELSTGPNAAYCGGDDIDYRAYSLFDRQGNSIFKVLDIEATLSPLIGIIDYNHDTKPEAIVQGLYSSFSLVEATGKIIQHIQVDYCDAGC